MKLSGKEKATIFLSILGSDTSSAILRYLPPELADIIASSINHLPTPTPEALGEVFSDFESYIALPSANKNYNRPKDVLEPVIDHPAQQTIQSNIKREEKNVSYVNMSDEDKILNADSKKLAYLLSDERPQIAAFILSIFPSLQREDVILNMSSSKDVLDNLMENIKNNSLTELVRPKLLHHFAEKL